MYRAQGCASKSANCIPAIFSRLSLKEISLYKILITSGIQELLTLINDNIGKTIFEKYTFPVSLVLRILSGITPTEEKIGELSDILLHRAEKDSRGNIIGWYRHKDIKKPADLSIIHTAHVVIAL